MRMVTIDGHATIFCRTTIALMLLAGSLLGNVYVIIAAVVIMLASGILGVDKAPLIVLYKVLFSKMIKPKKEVECVDSIRFSHFVGTAFGATGALLIFVGWCLAGWILIYVLTALQLIAMFGFCSAKKLYECLILGKNCCNLGKRIKGGGCSVR